MKHPVNFWLSKNKKSNLNTILIMFLWSLIFIFIIYKQAKQLYNFINIKKEYIELDTFINDQKQYTKDNKTLIKSNKSRNKKNIEKTLNTKVKITSIFSIITSIIENLNSSIKFNSLKYNKNKRSINIQGSYKKSTALTSLINSLSDSIMFKNITLESIQKSKKISYKDHSYKIRFNFIQ